METRYAIVRRLVTCITIACMFAGSAASQDDNPNAIHVRLVDEAGDPVSTAWIGTHASNSSELQDDWRLYPLQGKRVLSDEAGRAAITMDIRVDGTALLWAWHRDRALVGSFEVNRGMYGGPESEIVLMPACRAHGELISPELAAVDHEITWTNVYLHKGDHRPLEFTSESGRFEFMLPPGQFSLYAYGTDLATEEFDIEVPSGVAEIDLGTFELPASRLAKLYGQPAPELREIKEWMNGEPTTLQNLRGQYVLLEFWGSWCGPCIAKMPELMLIHSRLADRGLTLIGIHDDSIESVDALEERLTPVREERWDDHNIPFLVALDGGGEQRIEGTSNTARGATTAAYGITSFPTTVLIGPDGNVIERFHELSPEKSVQRLAEMMGVEPAIPVYSKALHAAYRLGNDEVLRFVEPPFVLERHEYFWERFIQSNQILSGIDPWKPRHAVWTWNGDRLDGSNETSSNLEFALNALSQWSVNRHYVEGEQDLLEWNFPGDIVFQSDSTVEERFQALADIVSDRLGEPIRIEARTNEESTVVARGTYQFKPLEQAWDPSHLHVYSDRFGEESEGGGGGSGTVEEFCRYIGQVVGLPFVDETESSESEFYWYHHRSGYLGKMTEAERQRLLPVLLKNLSDQTGLQYSVEPRPVTKWYVERVKSDS